MIHNKVPGAEYKRYLPVAPCFIFVIEAEVPSISESSV